MDTQRRHRTKFVFSFILVSMGCNLVYHLAIRAETYKYVFSSTVRHTPAVKVWKYVSDFSNIKNLIPNMMSFKIESKSGSYENWKYRVYYEEYVAQLPFVTNFAWADYETKKLSENQYVVYSAHKTCFGSSLLCLSTIATFEVEDQEYSPDSRYTETIMYQCPLLFTKLCKNEVQNQREHMKEMLDEVFENPTR